MGRFSKQSGGQSRANGAICKFNLIFEGEGWKIIENTVFIAKLNSPKFISKPILSNLEIMKCAENFFLILCFLFYEKISRTPSQFAMRFARTGYLT